MKTIVGILPWAVVVAAIGGATWWLLSRDIPAGRWLLAALLIGHGAVHVMFAIPASAAETAAGGAPAWPFDMARSWAVTGVGLDIDTIRAVGTVLIAVIVGGFALSALSTVAILVPPDWWRASLVLSAVGSAAMLLLFFEPQLLLGLGIDAVLVSAVAARVWAP